jgi:hypothetical protein
MKAYQSPKDRTGVQPLARLARPLAMGQTINIVA